MTDFPQPLRLAKGSHKPGSGKGCAMNVVSYTNGDTQITDFPECSAAPLSRLVQIVNDVLAGLDGFLSPENSVIALNLGWRTVGTRNYDYGKQSRWWYELTGERVLSSEFRLRGDEGPGDERAVGRAYSYASTTCAITGWNVYEGFPGMIQRVISWDKGKLIDFVNRAIDKWIELMPISPAEPITQAQIEYAMERIGQ
ncbi:hypothetical protein [Mycobacteroides immunogenum]|uniref:Uncharacterized protein n=1 Tax=Mycobacteroides immunogenum TaxID=83262 RepID=A0A7V8LQV3_9MYCO|nr:hypothetical protein [Mycobacteroides immunogenum]KPG13700.1 hypothetical protein AN909_05390 [Mycobacteroides immunogenum]KPG14311.1 hypothetical protein AN908_07015 [Mycobacteroides immunogenum]KPG14379.1 hypothetical protein AN908_07470 [Mycobacteroides immunogenum]KPG17414.1 hypothetical protein AN910_04615 [Mycobacteroides immunogenum]KPG24002.1 hypothetical protein AN911_00545 [Mycobacteroides immunogenum]